LRVSAPPSPANGNAAEFCDPPIDREIKKALTEQATNPQAANHLWEHVDRQTVNQAPWVPLVNPEVVDVLSKRAGNFQYDPMWAIRARRPEAPPELDRDRLLGRRDLYPVVAL